MRSGTELAREIQVTDWSTGGEQGKLVFLVRYCVGVLDNTEVVSICS